MYEMRSKMPFSYIYRTRITRENFVMEIASSKQNAIVSFCTDVMMMMMLLDVSES